MPLYHNCRSAFMMLLLPVALPLLRPAAATSQIPPLTPAQWRADLDHLRQRLPAGHLNLFHILPEARFHRELEALWEAADSASYEEMLVGMAALVASIGEGHTSVRILRPELNAFPMLAQVQDDGVRIRQIQRGHERLLGGSVTRIEGRPVEEVVQRLTHIISADNAMGVRAALPFYMITREVLIGLGLDDGHAGLALKVQRLDGVTQDVTIQPRPLPEVEELLSGSTQDMVAAGQKAPPLVRDARQGAYWFQWLPAQQAVFVRIDRLISQPDWPFNAFVDSLFREIDRHGPDRLVLDLRSLSGGNHISLPLVHELVRRPQISTQGRLFVLIGRSTFSAGQNLVALLEQHVSPIFVGEPTGGRPNSWGVLDRFKLAHSGLEVRHSRYFIQDTDPADYRHWQEPHIPAPPDVRAELLGRDPALDAALAFDGTFPWSRALSEVEAAYGTGGVASALTVARAHADVLRLGRWLVEGDVNQFGYRLLRAGSVDDAVAVFGLNIELFPQAWNAWDSSGEALAAAGRNGEAVEAFERSIALNGYNENARRALRLLALQRR